MRRCYELFNCKAMTPYLGFKLPQNAFSSSSLAGPATPLSLLIRPAEVSLQLMLISRWFI